MAKKSHSSSKLKSNFWAPKNMKTMLALATFLLAAVGGIWKWQTDSNFREVVEQYIDNGDVVTFEARYTPEQIMELRSKELLGEKERSFQNSELKFHPYVLFEVKYSDHDKKTKEGILLWDLVDGEMVISCEQWDKTHGFEDAINAKATRNDFKILSALEKAKGKMTMEQLQRELQIEEDVLLPWVENSKEKHLIVQKGNDIQLHFQNPRMLVTPQTKIDQCMVTKPYNQAQKVTRRYTSREIEKIAYAAFGSDFTIRTKKEVFLPIYNIEVSNRDGSILTTYWNALNGKRIIPNYLSVNDSR